MYHFCEIYINIHRDIMLYNEYDVIIECELDQDFDYIFHNRFLIFHL